MSAAPTHIPKAELPPSLLDQGLPSVLLPYQGKVLSTTSTIALTVIEKSRRIGVTWALAAAGVLTSGAARKAGGMDTLYLGPSLDMAREFIDAAAMWAKAFLPAASEVEEFLFKDHHAEGDKDIQAFRIKFASGFDIVALSSAPRSLRGRQGFVILDEAAFQDDLEEVLKAALALIMWGGRVAVVSTHNGDLNAFNQLVKEIRTGKRPGAHLRIDFDDALQDGLYRRICLVLGKEWTAEGEAAWRQEVVDFYGEDAEEELFCVPKAGTGAWLSRALIEARMQDGIPVLRWEQPDSFTHESDHIREAECLDFCERHLRPLLAALDPHLRTSLGSDFGRSGDLSVFWPFQVLADTTRRTPFVLELRNIPYKQQEQILYYIANRLPRLSGIAMDARGNGEALAEFAVQKYGSGMVEAVMLSTEWYRKNMPLYKAAFEDATVILPRDEDIASDHRAIVLDKGVAKLPEKGGRRKGTDGKQRHGDAAIAGALAYYASLIDVQVYEVLSTGERVRAFDEQPGWQVDQSVGFGVVRRDLNLGGY